MNTNQNIGALDQPLLPESSDLALWRKAVSAALGLVVKALNRMTRVECSSCGLEMDMEYCEHINRHYICHKCLPECRSGIAVVK